MIIKDVNLETVCGITSKLPANTQPEFAFAGKSNVGKSSLIYALMNRRSYARTSSQPGKTQTINFYHINDAFYYVDLPGYGYALTSLCLSFSLLLTHNNSNGIQRDLFPIADLIVAVTPLDAHIMCLTVIRDLIAIFHQQEITNRRMFHHIFSEEPGHIFLSFIHILTAEFFLFPVGF